MLKYLHFQFACDVAFAVFMITWVLARHVLYMMVVWSAYEDTKETMPYACFSREGAMIGSASTPRSKSFMQLIQPFIEPEGIICFNPKVKYTFLGMLLALQVITLIWFGMIVRVAWRIVNGGMAEDSRSDDEDETDEEEADVQRQTREESKDMKLRPLEEEVGVESIDLKGRRRGTTTTIIPSTRRHHHGTSSAISTSGVVTSAGNNIPSSTNIGVGGGGSTSSGTSGSSDRKELLGRIGCDKTT